MSHDGSYGEGHKIMSTDKTTISSRGVAVLRDPIRNRGTAFTDAQRAQLGLAGLLPPGVQTLMPKAVYHAYGYVKKAAAIVNGRAGQLPGRKAGSRPTTFPSDAKPSPVNSPVL